ncbi:PP2C family protein-serine/threonine phosphatase [Helcococcus kunzii]|uniref:PP2C family protein-serine/threonine phosphatase n=1 Tax=Helcococcus kunzii TaxID=40091 RepID=UPI0024AD8E75|nr:protein phosphatase 2C domain-containing protein [Helcococcus kunzii]
MKVIISAHTDKGNIKDTNQDSYLVRNLDVNNRNFVVAAIADGMGGHSQGELASSSIINAIKTWSVSVLPNMIFNGLDDQNFKNAVKNLIDKKNSDIKFYGKKNNITIGSTLTLLLLTDDRYYIANVGDTRAYEITDNNIRIITKDQTLVQREVDQGIITKEQAKTDARKSVLLQSIGTSIEVYPDFYFGDTRKDTVFLLCSDGFRHEISNYEILNMLSPSSNLSENEMKNNLVELIELNKQRQERDNITALSILIK